MPCGDQSVLAQEGKQRFTKKKAGTGFRLPGRPFVATTMRAECHGLAAVGGFVILALNSWGQRRIKPNVRVDLVNDFKP